MFYKQPISLFKFLLLLISLPNKCYNFSFISIISPPYFNRCNFSWKFLQILSSELGGGSCIHPRWTYLNLLNSSLAINLGPTHPYEQGWKTSGPFPSVKHLYTVGSGLGRRSSSSCELQLVSVFGCIPPSIHPPTITLRTFLKVLNLRNSNLRSARNNLHMQCNGLSDTEQPALL